MNLVIFNLGWMSWNLFLACLGVVFGWSAVRARSRFWTLFFVFLWLLFVPNTLYILTDLKHLPDQLSRISSSIHPFILLQFCALITGGLITYIYSMHFIEKVIRKLTNKFDYAMWPIILLANFAISFAVVMGRIMRTNSWYVFTEPNRVIMDVFQTLGSSEYMSYVVMFWIVSNIIYLSVKESFTPRKLFTYVFAEN